MNAPPDAPPPAAQIPQSQPAPAPRKRGFLGCGCGGLTLLALLCLAGGLGLIEFLRLDSWNSGLASYNEGRCDQAIEQLTRIEDIPGAGLAERFNAEFQPDRVPTMITECNAFETAVAPAEADGYGRAAAYLMAFHGDYPDSALNAVAGRRIAEWYEEAGASGFADDDFCQALYTAEDTGQLSEIESEIPAITFECGNYYVAEGDYENGLVFYSRFRDQYPDHALAPEVEEALAEAEVAFADALGAPEISQPTAVGNAPAGEVLWSVRNDSPNRIQIILSGDETLIEEIEPCEGCREYESTPKDCPGVGPVRDIQFPPGDYQVVVKAIGDGSVTPYRGTFAFEDGTAYDECFFVTVGEGYDPAEDPIVAPSGSAPATILESRSTFDMEPGLCFEFPADYVGDVDIYDCAEPHLYEVFAVFDTAMGADGAFPGDDEIEEIGTEECLPYFEPYVGIDYDLSMLYYFVMTPNESSWADGDREMVCVLYQPEEDGQDDLRLLGSMEGAAR